MHGAVFDMRRSVSSDWWVRGVIQNAVPAHLRALEQTIITSNLFT